MDNSNRVLASLAPGDLAALKPHLKHVYLEHKRVLFDAGDEIESVYFPMGSVISLVVGLSTGDFVEIAMVGKDGVAGVSSALDGKIAINRAIVQLPGEAMTCGAAAFKGAVLQSEKLLSLLMRHEQTLYVQAQQSTACMAAHNVEERLCRWLLRARDLCASDTLLFTQEFLAEMLGVRRTSVTLVAHTLQQAGIIKYSRGKIQVLNVEGLQEAACECYSAVKSHYDELIGKH
jgi:CRP-like cAMP-binding protein